MADKPMSNSVPNPSMQHSINRAQNAGMHIDINSLLGYVASGDLNVDEVNYLLNTAATYEERVSGQKQPNNNHTQG